MPEHADRAADVTMDRGNPARTGLMPGPGPAGAPVVRWRFPLGEHHVSSVIVVSGVVYVNGSHQPLCAIAAASGQERWRFTGSGAVWGIDSDTDLNGRTPAYADGLLVVCSTWARREHALVYAVDANSGQEHWRFATIGNDILPAPTVDAGVVYVTDHNTDGQIRTSYLYALYTDTGQARWRFRSEGQLYASPAVAGGLVYVGSASGHFFALDVASGQERWRFQTRDPFEDDWYAHVSHAAIAEGRVFVSSSSNETLFALDAISGRERWRRSGISSTLPAVADGVVYCLESDKSLCALDAASGQEQWRVPPPAPADTFCTAPTVAAGRVYIGARSSAKPDPEFGVLSALDAASGQERWRLPIDGHTLTDSPVVADGVVYLSGSYEGVLIAIAGTDTPSPLERATRGASGPAPGAAPAASRRPSQLDPP